MGDSQVAHGETKETVHSTFLGRRSNSGYEIRIRNSSVSSVLPVHLVLAGRDQHVHFDSYVVNERSALYGYRRALNQEARWNGALS